MLSTTEQTQPEGHWLTTATVANTPTGKLEWDGIARRGYTAMVGKVQIAVVRYYAQHRHWRASMPGWMWTVTPDMEPSRLGIKETPVKVFKSRAQAQAAIERAWAIPRHDA